MSTKKPPVVGKRRQRNRRKVFAFQSALVSIGWDVGNAGSAPILPVPRPVKTDLRQYLGIYFSIIRNSRDRLTSIEYFDKFGTADMNFTGPVHCFYGIEQVKFAILCMLEMDPPDYVQTMLSTTFYKRSNGTSYIENKGIARGHILIVNDSDQPSPNKDERKSVSKKPLASGLGAAKQLESRITESRTASSSGMQQEDDHGADVGSSSNSGGGGGISLSINATDYFSRKVFSTSFRADSDRDSNSTNSFYHHQSSLHGKGSDHVSTRATSGRIREAAAEAATEEEKGSSLVDSSWETFLASLAASEHPRLLEGSQQQQRSYSSIHRRADATNGGSEDIQHGAEAERDFALTRSSVDDLDPQLSSRSAPPSAKRPKVDLDGNNCGRKDVAHHSGSSSSSSSANGGASSEIDSEISGLHSKGSPPAAGTSSGQQNSAIRAPQISPEIAQVITTVFKGFWESAAKDRASPTAETKGRAQDTRSGAEKQKHKTFSDPAQQQQQGGSDIMVMHTDNNSAGNAKDRAAGAAAKPPLPGSFIGPAVAVSKELLFYSRTVFDIGVDGRLTGIDVPDIVPITIEQYEAYHSLRGLIK